MTSNKDVPGFVIPFHRSLMEVVLTAGLPKTVAFLLWTTTAALAFGMRQWWILPPAILLHLGLAYVAKGEPYFFDIFLRAIKAPKSLQP